MIQVEYKENRGRKIIVDQEIKACDKCRCTWEKVKKADRACNNGELKYEYELGKLYSIASVILYR